MKRIALPLAIAAAIFATTVVLTAEMWHGRFVVPSYYDDVQYLFRGLKIYELFYRLPSVWAFLMNWPGLDMHSPVADLQAFFGFLVFGNSVVGPYWFSAIYLSLFLWMVLRLFEQRPIHLLLAVCLLILTTPFVLSVVTNLKSDYVAGLFFVLATMCILEVIPFSSARHRFFWAIGLSSAAILSKPTGIHIPLILCGTLFLGWVLQFATTGTISTGNGAVRAVALHERARRSLTPHLLIGLGITVLVSLFMWGRFTDIISYVLWQMNPDSGFYAEARSLPERLLSRLPLTYRMKLVWGMSFYWFVLLTIVGNSWIFWRGTQLEKLRSACFFLVVLVTYTTTVLTPFANLSFASLFFFSTIGYMIYMLSVLAGRLSKNHVMVLSALIVGSTLFGHMPKSIVQRGPGWMEIERINQVFDQLVTDINAHEIYSVVGSGLNNTPLTNSGLHLHARLQRLPGRPKQQLKWHTFGSLFNEQYFRKVLARSEMFIGVDRQVHRSLPYEWRSNYPYGLPLQVVESDPEFVELARYPLGEATFFVYIKASLLTVDNFESLPDSPAD